MRHTISQPLNKQSDKLPLVVLISGSGSNLQAIIDQIANGQLSAEIALVVSNNKKAFGLQRAKTANIPTLALDHRQFDSREDYDLALIQSIDAALSGHAGDHSANRAQGHGLIVLAGFMRILSEAFVNHYANRLINIHPSLLPAYKGLDTHQRVLDAGEKQHGVSVHFVTAELDAGPVIIQCKIDIDAQDTADTLAQRIHRQEHLIYPTAIGWIAEGRIQIKDNRVLLDGSLSSKQLVSETL